MMSAKTIVFVLILFRAASVSIAESALPVDRHLPNLDSARFVPPGAELVKQVMIAFEPDRQPSVAVAYSKKVDELDFVIGIRILDYQGSRWGVVYEEHGLVGTAGGPVAIDKVQGSTGNEALMVVLTYSGAGTSTNWHLIARRKSKFLKLDAAPLRNRVLKRRGYEFEGYNGVTIKENTVFEDVAGYSPTAARCCPDRPPLKIGFEFTGSRLRVTSIKIMPLGSN